MATRDDVRRLALALPEVVEDDERFGFRVDGKLIAWVWLERVDPNKARRPNPDVLAVRTPSEDEKWALIDLDPSVFFTERHYDGYPAILVRLPQVDLEMLCQLLTNAWRSKAPKRLLTSSSGPGGPSAS
jgi:hypothetical protein